MKNKIILFFLFVFFVYFVGCEMGRKSIGKDNEIVVVADQFIWDYLEIHMEGVFGREIITPQYENIFYLKHYDYEEFLKNDRWQNIIIVGTLNSQDKVSKMVQLMLSEEVKRNVEEGETFVFTKKDQWARNQLVMILVSNTATSLKDKLKENSDELFKIFDTRYTEKYYTQMFRKLEQKDIEKYLMDKYGWSVRIQHDYRLDKEFPDSIGTGFVWLRRLSPDRWFFVYWENLADSSKISPEWLLEKREEIGRIFYEGDVTDTAWVVQTNFQGRKALRTIGLWKNLDKKVGGPFRNYCFYDDRTKRIYILDIAVFAAGEAKEPYLRQLEIIAHTFRTK
jgi:hypothetical protein